MGDVYRCANCGSELTSPFQTCRACGYQRRSTQPAARQVMVVLIEKGPNQKDIEEVIEVHLRKRKDHVRQMLAHVPVIVYQGFDEGFAEELNNRLVSLGAKSEFQVPDRGEVQAEEHSDIPSSAQSPIGCLSRLVTILLVFLAIISSLIPRNKDKIKEFLDRYDIDVPFLESSNEFDRVHVIVARESISKGEVIEWKHLEKKLIRRANAPAGAIAPLFVDQLIGKPSPASFPAGSIIALRSESVSDNE